MVQPSPSSADSADEALAAALRDPHASELYEAALRAYLAVLAASPSESVLQRWDVAFAELVFKRLAGRLTQPLPQARSLSEAAAGLAGARTFPLGRSTGELLSNRIIRERR